MRTCSLALIVAALQVAGAGAQPTRPQQGSAGSTAAAGQPERLDPQLGVSLDKIRKELEEAPPPPAAPLKIGPLPTFRVTVYGQRKPLLPDFTETLKQEWQPVVPGGIHNMEIMNMITPPQARPFQAHVNTDLVQVAASALVNELFERAIITGYRAVRRGLRNYQEDRIREEVSAELAAFLLANPQPPPQKKIEDKRTPDR